MINIMNIKPGEDLEPYGLSYPKHGKKNILCNVVGACEKTAKSKCNKNYIVVKRQDGTYRSYLEEKLVRLKNETVHP